MQIGALQPGSDAERASRMSCRVAGSSPAMTVEGKGGFGRSSLTPPSAVMAGRRPGHPAKFSGAPPRSSSHPLSSQRKRGPKSPLAQTDGWAPAFAGVTPSRRLLPGHSTRSFPRMVPGKGRKPQRSQSAPPASHKSIHVSPHRRIFPLISPATDGTGQTDGAGGQVGAGLRYGPARFGLNARLQECRA